MRISGNKGEWSELYAFIRLLYLGRLYAADENVKKLDDIFFPILKILREDHSKKLIEYVIDSTTGDVDIIIEKETESCDSRGKRYYYGKKSYIWQRTEKYSILFAALSFVIFSSDTVWNGRPFYHRSV